MHGDDAAAIGIVDLLGGERIAGVTGITVKAGATVQVIDRNPDKAAAAALLGDFRAVAAAGLRGCTSTPLTADAARRALSLADAAIQRLAAQVNPKITLSVLAAKLG